MTMGRAPRLISGVFACLLVLAAFPGRGMASEESEKALKEQMRLMQQQMDELRKEVQALRHEQQAAAASSGAAQPPATAPAAPGGTATAGAAAPSGGTASPGGTAAPGGMPPPAPKNAKEISREPLFEKFLKGFYGTLDVSFDDTTKGINGLTAYSYGLADPANPNSGYVQGGVKGGPVGRLGYLPALSTNKSQLGYRNTHQIGSSATDFIV
jgi:hypothetical protein